MSLDDYTNSSNTTAAALDRAGRRSSFQIPVSPMTTPADLDLLQIYCTVREPSNDDSAPAMLPVVTAFSDGLTASAAARIAAICGRPSAIASGLRLTSDITDANPYVVYDYVPRLSLCEITVDDRRKLWAASRSVYLGDRTLTHILLCETYPGAELFAAMERDGLWCPADYSLADDNQGLRDMIDGFAGKLPVLRLTVEPMPITMMADIHELTMMLPPLIEVERRRMAGLDKQPSAVAVRCSAGRIPSIIAALGALPERVTKNLTFTTAYGRDETDCPVRLVFVSDQSPEFPESAMIIDTITGAATGYEMLPVHDLIVRMIEERDYVSASALAGWWIDNKNDRMISDRYGPELFLAVGTSRPLDHSIATPEFIREAIALCSDEESRERLIGKLNSYIDVGLKRASKSSVLLGAIEAAGIMVEKLPGALALSEESLDRLARLLIRSGSKGYLGRMVTAANLPAILSLIVPERMGTIGQLLGALSLSRVPEVWAGLLYHYFRGDPAQAIDIILPAVASSSMSEDDSTRAVVSLFPLAERATQLIDWYRINPQNIVILPGPVKAICLSARDECFSRLLSGPASTDAVRRVAPFVTEFFSPRIDSAPDQAMIQLLDMVGHLRPDQIGPLTLTPLLERYESLVWNNPGENTASVAERLCRSGLLLPDTLRHRLNMLRSVLNGVVYGSAVTPDDMIMAARVRPHDIEMRSALFAYWMASKISADDLTGFLSAVKISDPTLIESMIQCIWGLQADKESRSELIRIVIDNVSWDSDERRAFVSECGDGGLQQVLGYKKSLASKLGALFRR